MITFILHPSYNKKYIKNSQQTNTVIYLILYALELESIWSQTNVNYACLNTHEQCTS